MLRGRLMLSSLDSVGYQKRLMRQHPKKRCAAITLRGWTQRGRSILSSLKSPTLTLRINPLERHRSTYKSAEPAGGINVAMPRFTALCGGFRAAPTCSVAS